jgi:hypothetical protein
MARQEELFAELLHYIIIPDALHLIQLIETITDMQIPCGCIRFTKGWAFQFRHTLEL